MKKVFLQYSLYKVVFLNKLICLNLSIQKFTIKKNKVLYNI